MSISKVYCAHDEFSQPVVISLLFRLFALFFSLRLVLKLQKKNDDDPLASLLCHIRVWIKCETKYFTWVFKEQTWYTQQQYTFLFIRLDFVISVYLYTTTRELRVIQNGAEYYWILLLHFLLSLLPIYVLCCVRGCFLTYSIIRDTRWYLVAHSFLELKE